MKSKFMEKAQKEAKKSTLQTKVGAVLVLGKTIISGHNKDKTHPEFANPQKHIRTSLHAELDCLIKARNNKFPTTLFSGGTVYVSREVNGKPAMARPCEHCISFLRDAGIEKMMYSIPERPYIASENL